MMKNERKEEKESIEYEKCELFAKIVLLILYSKQLSCWNFTIIYNKNDDQWRY